MDFEFELECFYYPNGRKKHLNLKTSPETCYCYTKLLRDRDLVEKPALQLFGT